MAERFKVGRGVVGKELKSGRTLGFRGRCLLTVAPCVGCWVWSGVANVGLSVFWIWAYPIEIVCTWSCFEDIV